VRLVRALGWFSVGLGAAEVARPRTLAGLPDGRRTLRAFGLREIGPSFVITHYRPLEEAPRGMLRDKEDECVKVVLKP